MRSEAEPRCAGRKRRLAPMQPQGQTAPEHGTVVASDGAGAAGSPLPSARDAVIPMHPFSGLAQRRGGAALARRGDLPRLRVRPQRPAAAGPAHQFSASTRDRAARQPPRRRRHGGAVGLAQIAGQSRRHRPGHPGPWQPRRRPELRRRVSTPRRLDARHARAAARRRGVAGGRRSVRRRRDAQLPADRPPADRGERADAPAHPRFRRAPHRTRRRTGARARGTAGARVRLPGQRPRRQGACGLRCRPPDGTAAVPRQRHRGAGTSGLRARAALARAGTGGARAARPSVRPGRPGAQPRRRWPR